MNYAFLGRQQLRTTQLDVDRVGKDKPVAAGETQAQPMGDDRQDLRLRGRRNPLHTTYGGLARKACGIDKTRDQAGRWAQPSARTADSSI